MASEEESEVASKEIVGQKTTKVVEEVAEVCENPQRPQRKWFTSVSQKLGEISVMMRRKDHWKIS
jgi:hypothetical protein